MYIYNAKTGKMEESHYKKSKIRDFIIDVRFRMAIRRAFKQLNKEEKARN